MKFGVVQFPGSNCDEDAYHAVGAIIHQPVEFIWHQSENVSGFDADHSSRRIRVWRLSAHRRDRAIFSRNESGGPFCASGGLVLGICNGFQILLEAGLLPGAMMRNKGLRFFCRQVHIRVETTDTPFTCAAQARPSAENSHRAHGRKLFLRAADACRAGAQQSNYFSLRAAGWRTPAADDREANPNGSLARHCRHLQPRAQRAGLDAASRARRGVAAGLRRRPGDFPFAGGKPGAAKARSARHDGSIPA